MKIFKITGLVVSLIGFACAPVASSVPKLTQQTPRTGDTVVVEGEKKFDLGVVDSVEVVSKDEYEAFEKKLAGDYRLVKYHEKDKKLSDLRERLPVNEIEISSKIDRAEMMVIFVLDGATVSKEKASKIKLAWMRGEKGLLSMSIDERRTSDETWSTVKKYLSSMVIAYREAKAKK